jgi:DNA helicase-2/ATP-dependent DNA helicase PcrA
MDPERVLQGLDATQRQAVSSESQPLAILAGAGSGKTRVLTRRIAFRCASGTADARHVLAVTFTRKAASELDGRLRAFGLRDLPAAGTFHALAYAQLRTRWAALGIAPPVLLDRKGRTLARILGGTTRIGPADLGAEIEWAKARLITPEQYPRAAARADRRLPVPPERVADWFEKYELEKRRRGAVDFDDLLTRCADAILEDPSFAAAQRWRFRHLFVDEYQDLNPLQERLLRAWLGDRQDLCVVGDPNQAIYGWNGADASFLVQFAKHHRGAEVVELRHSYRSTPQILATAAAVLDGGHGRSAPLEAHRPDGPPPVIAAFATDADEANGVARAVRDLHGPGRSWSSQALLVRTNAQATLFEAAFRRAAIPYRVRGASQLLDQPDVRDLFKRFDRMHEPLATTLADLATALTVEREQLGAGDDAGDDEPTMETSAAGRRLLAREQIVRLGRDLLLLDPTARTDGFSGWLRTVLQDDDSRRTDAVEIVSFHAAKGLEWPVVHIAGLEAGLVPITHARTPEARAEERRLLYVAITRAGEVLRCSWARRRTFGEREMERSPSPFLGELRSAVAEFHEPEPAIAPTEGLAASRAALAGSRPSTSKADDLRADLRAWRATQARAADVAPTVVLSDRALEAVAQVRPRSADELAEMAEVGPLVQATHGARLLAIVAAHPDDDDHPLVPRPHVSGPA